MTVETTIPRGGGALPGRTAPRREDLVAVHEVAVGVGEHGSIGVPSWPPAWA